MSVPASGGTAAGPEVLPDDTSVDPAGETEARQSMAMDGTQRSMAMAGTQRSTVMDGVEELAVRVVHVMPWADPIVDQRGVDPRSSYVEHFWLGVLGPSATLLLRHLAERFDAEPEGFLLDLAAVAGALGLAARRGRNAPFPRAISRSIRFGMMRYLPPDTLAVRRRLGPLPRRLLLRLPDHVQAAHRDLERAVSGEP
jgi:hypothetical protein